MTSKVIVVEDEVLVGMDLVMMLEDWGYVVDGPHANVESAFDAIHVFEPDVGVLDLNLGGGMTSLPVAEALRARGTPFLFLTGYSRFAALDESTAADAPRLSKPVQDAVLKITPEARGVPSPCCPAGTTRRSRPGR